MKWLSHIGQGILILVFLMAGLTKLFSNTEQIIEMYSDPFGYPPIFMYFIGVIELIAALGLIAGYRWRRIAVLSSLLVLILLLGIIASNLMINAFADALLPIMYLLLLIGLLIRLIHVESVMKIQPQ
ncbi:DoxX family protein [Oceanobacillus jeddahense]|uniref:DoxX family protein n=1 Tax=Oceanobacillus jeddahense TaxID=1462527 RepID=UPI003629632C